jgi:hypothetical protein
MPVRGWGETSSGNFLNRATGRYRSPIAGKLRHVGINPKQLNLIKPLIALCGNGFSKQLQDVAA